MNKKQKDIIVILGVLTILSCIVIHVDINLCAIAALITLALFNRNYVIYLYIGYMFFNIIIAKNFSILTLLNTLIIAYLAYLNWTNISGKTFSAFRDMNLRGTIILSAILQCISMLLVVFQVHDIKFIIFNLINWMQAMAFFLAYILFSIRSIRCFNWFFIGGVIKLLIFIFVFFIAGGNLVNIIPLILYLMFIGLILLNKRHSVNNYEDN